MPGGSPTAYLLWSILSPLFFSCHLYHLWSYDRFKCLKWNHSGRHPGAFKRFMSYTYIAALTLLTLFAVAFTVLKFHEGFLSTPDGQLTPVPLEYFSPHNKKWLLPLLLVFSIAWGCELVTHLEELTFWLFLQNQGPTTRLWFESCEFRFWLWGTLFALLGMPLTTFISRRQLDSCLAWTFLVGSSASTATSLAFLYVLWRFPAFIRRVKYDGAAPNVVLRLVFFFHLHCGRIIFRFLFSVPLFALSLDGVQGPHTINNSPFWPDFLLMVGGIGAFVSSAITLLIFFPRSLIEELGYTVVVVAKSPAMGSVDLNRLPMAFNQRPVSPKDPVPIVRMPSAQHSFDLEHDASPEYESEDPSHAAHPDPLQGDSRIRAWRANSAETPGTGEVRCPESHVFDRRSRGLIRSRSEGRATLHPYVRGFRSPIDIDDVEALDNVPER